MLDQLTEVFYEVDDVVRLPKRNGRPTCTHRHKTFAARRRGKTSMGWFFGFELHFVFNNLNETIACKLTSGHVHDTRPMPQLTKYLLGKLFGDKGYVGKSWCENCYALA